MRVLGASASGIAASLIPSQRSAPRSSGREVLPAQELMAAEAYPAFSRKSLFSMRLLAPPAIDGDLSDWPVAESTELSRNTAFAFSGRIDSLADLSAIIRSGWDEQTLFVAAQVSDDVLVTDSSDVWRDDGVEFGLDGLNDKNAWGTDDHQYTIVADGRVTDRSVPTTGISAAVMSYEGGYNVELAIPMEQLMAGTPVSGTVMGFTIGLHDDDDGDNWDAYLIWEGTSTGSLPEEFGSLVFSERLDDRLEVLEVKIGSLERQVRQLLTILGEFEGLPTP